MPHKHMDVLTVIGGGLAGSEAAWQAANRGVSVHLYEMRPHGLTGAHETSLLAELVCSNSLGSRLSDRASGLIKEELRLLGSLLVQVAERNAVPAGNSLSVDRDAFAAEITHLIENHPNISVIRQEAVRIPNGHSIVATGPLTSPLFSQEIVKVTGKGRLFFYDAIAPIINADSIDMEIAFRASRYGRGELEDGDYINCPLTKEQYDGFVTDLLEAKRIELKPFEAEIDQGVKSGSAAFFEGCLPVEVMAARGKEVLAYGPMRPVGLRDPKTGKWPYAVLQLRQDNLAGSLYNMVGFQTNLLYAEQMRVFRKIPGLEHAKFARLGQMHRNTYMASPLLLDPSMQYRGNNRLYFAGQITGIEGYIGNIASGYVAGVNAARSIFGESPLVFPTTTMIGALCHYISHADMSLFQPMKANFGILPALALGKSTRRERQQEYARRAIADIQQFIRTNAIKTI